MVFLKWAAIFFLVAVIAAVFGFTGIAAGAAEIAEILFYIFLAICIIFLAIGLFVAQKIF